MTPTKCQLSLIQVVVCICLYNDAVHGMVVSKFEMEYVTGGPGRVRSPWRSRASGFSALHAFRGDRVLLGLCVQEPTLVEIVGVVFSNDGDRDVVTFSVNGKRIGTLKTLERHGGFGDLWDDFEESEQVGSPFELAPGVHGLEVYVEDSDCHGIELDYISFVLDSVNIENIHNMARDSLWCKKDFILSPEPFQCDVKSNEVLTTAPTKLSTSQWVTTIRTDDVSVTVLRDGTSEGEDNQRKSKLRKHKRVDEQTKMHERIKEDGLQRSSRLEKDDQRSIKDKQEKQRSKDGKDKLKKAIDVDKKQPTTPMSTTESLTKGKPFTRSDFTSTTSTPISTSKPSITSADSNVSTPESTTKTVEASNAFTEVTMSIDTGSSTTSTASRMPTNEFNRSTTGALIFANVVGEPPYETRWKASVNVVMDDDVFQWIKDRKDRARRLRQ